LSQLHGLDVGENDHVLSLDASPSVEFAPTAADGFMSRQNQHHDLSCCESILSPGMTKQASQQETFSSEYCGE
jgi:hypothetical protein